MKRLIKLFVIIGILALATPHAVYAEDEYATESLLETQQEGEVVLNIDESSSTDIISPTQNEPGDMTNNTELDFEVFKVFEEENKSNEESLIEKVFHSKITRTDVPTFLLQDDLTFKPQKGIVSKVQIFGAHQGNLNSIWDPRYSTKYNHSVTEFGLIGQFKNPDYKFRFAFKPIPAEGMSYFDSAFSDIYIANTFIPNHQIIAGYSRVQTGVEGGASAYTLPFVNRSQIARNFGNTRSLALKIVGNYQYADYNFAFGSSSRYITRGFTGGDFNSWINVKPFGNKSKKYGKLTLGAGYSGGHNRINYNVASAYIGYNHKKLWTNFEAAIADGYNGSHGISSNKACGYAATLGWKFTPHWQLIGRIDQFDPNRHTSNDLRREYTIGINWFVKGQALKMVLNYVFCNNQNRANSHRLIVGTQILI